MRAMEHNVNNDGGIPGIILSLASILLYFLNIFTVSDWAGIFAIGAGATAMLYNFTKWFMLIRKRKK